MGTELKGPRRETGSTVARASGMLDVAEPGSSKLAGEKTVRVPKRNLTSRAYRLLDLMRDAGKTDRRKVERCRGSAREKSERQRNIEVHVSTLTWTTSGQSRLTRFTFGSVVLTSQVVHVLSTNYITPIQSKIL
jgi:hypothetical protein